MTLFLGSLLLMFASLSTSLVLSHRLKLTQPELHRSLQIYPWSSTPQFWIFRFLAPSKLRRLTATDKFLAGASIVLLSAGLFGLGVWVIGTVIHGNL